MLEIRSQDRVHQVKRRLTLSSSTAATALLEREAPLEALTMGLREAATGDGRIALVYGEAGIGKTSLLRLHISPRRSITTSPPFLRRWRSPRGRRPAGWPADTEWRAKTGRRRAPNREGFPMRRRALACSLAASPEQPSRNARAAERRSHDATLHGRAHVPRWSCPPRQRDRCAGLSYRGRRQRRRQRDLGAFVRHPGQEEDLLHLRRAQPRSDPTRGHAQQAAGRPDHGGQGARPVLPPVVGRAPGPSHTSWSWPG